MLSTSDFAKQLTNHRYEQLKKPDLIPACELSFVKMVVDWLYSNRHQEEKWTQLVMVVAQNYEVLFISPSHQDYGRLLFQMILDGSRSNRLPVVVQFVEFWTELKQSLLDSISSESTRLNASQSDMLVQLDSNSNLC